MRELLSYRQEFPILATTTYLVNHSLGAMPRAVSDRLREYVDLWATRGVRAWADAWWEKPLATGDKLAPVIGAAPGTVVMHQNVSICQSVILSGIDFEKAKREGRDRIVYESMNFPSVMYVYEAHARAHGLTIVEVPTDDGVTIDTERMLAAIDERTLLVPISHVLFRSAYIQDAAAIIQKAHSVGAMVVLDAYQSAGAVPLDVTALNVDFATGGSVKWLCAGPGAGWLYVRPDLQTKFQPAVTGWAAHRAPFAFEPGAIDYATGIHRFLHGTPGVPALYAAEPGYELIAEIGVARIRANSMRQTARLIEMAAAEGWKINSPLRAEQRGGTVIFDVPHAGAVVRELERREILVDYRPGAGIRIGPHFFNTDAELEAVIAGIRDILTTRAYEKHLVSGGANR
ncbi:MAG: aminotransferase class V-fold PLP-dependent enzyme [Blastocatellia bacterium]